MASPQEDLRDRTKRFAYRIIKLFRTLSKSTEAQVIGKQLLRSGTAVAANYRAAARARSQAEFISKISIVVEEADETVFWLECLADNGIVRRELLTELLKEGNELLAIVCGVATHSEATRSKGRTYELINQWFGDPIARLFCVDPMAR